MKLWAGRLLIALFVTSLVGCQSVIYTQPYLLGTFVGTYQPDSTLEDPENLPSFPITIKSRLVSTEASRYTFEGTAELNGKTYTMTGFEENSSGGLVYVAPQAHAVAEDFVMTLQGEANTEISICGEVYYLPAGGSVPPSLYG